MPVAQGGAPARQALLVGLGMVCALGVVVFLVTRLGDLTGGGQTTIELGDPIFSPGPADDFAALVEQQGPVFLPDAAGGDRGIFIHHLGATAEEGWVALAVRPSGAPRSCFVEWDGTDRTFVDNCDGTVYPESGEGLVQYPISVDLDGNLRINLNLPDGEPSDEEEDEGE